MLRLWFAGALLLALLAHPLAAAEEVVFHNGHTKLTGTLYLPPGRGPHPAIVVLHAANGATRDYFAYRHLIDALPAAGFAVLLYDRRGSGASTGDFNTATFQDLAADAIAGVSYLETRKDIRRHRIGVWGLSQGGWIASLAAATSGAIAFLISVSGPGVTPAAQMDYTASYALKADGESPDIIARALKVREVVNDYYRGHQTLEKAEEAVGGIRGEAWFRYVSLPNGGNLPADPAKTKWFRVMDYEPLRALARVRVPSLFIFAETDEYVPVDVSIEKIKTAMAGKPVTIQRIAGSDHYMTCGSATCPAYVAALLRWLQTAPDR